MAIVSKGEKGGRPPETAVVSSPNGGDGRVRHLHTSLDGIFIELIPDRLKVEVRSVTSATPADRVNKLWHEVNPPKGIRIRITSEDTRYRLLRLSAECEDRTWNGRWVRWSYAIRKTPELLGGDAVDAQDILTSDGMQLKLLLAPGETREATLEIAAVLDGETQTGDYLFDVVAEDITDGDSGTLPTTTKAGILSLRHPACDLLTQLPSIYHEALYPPEEEAFGYRDPEFFERYLLGFEDFWDRLSETLANLDKVFAPYSSPPDYLVWLAAWVCMPLDENWSEMKQRQLIREAVELYRWRGTRRGLSRYLHIYTGVAPEINDIPFKGMRLGPHAKLGTDETILGDVPDHTFVVTLTLPEGADVDEKIVHGIIRYEKPAHTAYTLNIVNRQDSGIGIAEPPPPAPAVREDKPTESDRGAPIELPESPDGEKDFPKDDLSISSGVVDGPDGKADVEETAATEFEGAVIESTEEVAPPEDAAAGVEEELSESSDEIESSEEESAVSDEAEEAPKPKKSPSKPKPKPKAKKKPKK